MKLQWKDRIRLNNVIWRAYYMQCKKINMFFSALNIFLEVLFSLFSVVQNNKPRYCFFSVPEDDSHSSRSEVINSFFSSNCEQFFKFFSSPGFSLFKASILEGMYWKRRLETVCAQYTRWRHYYFKQGKRRRSSVSREVYFFL